MKQGRLKVTTVYSESWTSVAEYETFTYQEDGQPVSVTVDVLNTNHSASVYWGVDVHTDPAEVFNAENTTFEWTVQPHEEHGVIAHGGDLDDLKAVGTYCRDAAGSASNVVAHVPDIAGDGTFVLEVLPGGGAGQLVQRLTVCSKAKAIVCQRAFYQNAWGAWQTVSYNGGDVLWSGAMYMQGSHTIALAEKVSDMPNGIVLVFSGYSNGAAQDADFVEFFVPKQAVALHPGKGHAFLLVNSNSTKVARKYLYINDATIDGHDGNTVTGTVSGIDWANNYFVLRYVLGV